MKYLTLILIIFLLCSCADSKTFTIEGQKQEIKPYGWATTEERNPNVVYTVNAGNVIWSIIGIETIFIPIWLTGWELFEPYELKDCSPNCPKY